MPNLLLDKSTQRFAGCLLFLAVMCLASDCHAQRHRRFFKRAFHAPQPTARQVTNIESSGSLEQAASPARGGYLDPPRVRKFGSTDSGAHVDPRIRFDETGWERYPKWYGGFHSSHFTDVGIPHGDRGFRGNGIYWTPW